jgi:MSHA biogenesis protein MshG
MPNFTYQGRDSTGKLVSGKRTAQSADMLGAQLTKEGVIPISILAGEASKTDLGSLKDKLFREKVSQEEMGVFARQMYTLVKTGVPLASALRNLAASMRNATMRKTLFGVVEHLEAGQDLANSMQNYPVFSPMLISMVRVGQSSGDLANSFLRINQYIELEGSAVKNIKTAMRYPMFVMIALTLAIVLINIFVIPAFAHVFTQAHMDLPWATRFFIAFSNFMINYWYVILGVVALAAGSFYHYINTVDGRLVWDKFVLRIPIIGPLLKRIVLLRFAQSFSITINSGIPLIQGIELISQSVNNAWASSRILKMRESIERGNNLAQSAATTDLFSPLELQILGISEQTGELGPMLDQIASFYRREVEYDLKKLSDIVEPVLIVFLAAVILVLAFAVYLPIWNMAKLARMG